MQRRIDAFLDEADEAASRKDWTTVAENARAVLAIDEANDDALSFLKMAEANGVSRTAGSQSGPAAAALTRQAQPLPAAFGGGRYRVSRLLGEGGRKQVYLARDTTLDREVAIAVLGSKGSTRSAGNA